MGIICFEEIKKKEKPKMLSSENNNYLKNKQIYKIRQNNSNSNYKNFYNNNDKLSQTSNEQLINNYSKKKIQINNFEQHDAYKNEINHESKDKLFSSTNERKINYNSDKYNINNFIQKTSPKNFLIYNEYNEKKSSTSKENKSYMDVALKIHNIFRKKYGIQELKLNNDLCTMAQKYAEKCANSKNIEFFYDLYNNDIIGQNISLIENKSLNVAEICQKWYSEKKDYNFSSNKYIKGTGHFTQLIWKNTKEVGFGYKEDDNGNIYFVANYYPAGNIFNQFNDNVMKEKE